MHCTRKIQVIRVIYPVKHWRRERDSNPREPFDPNSFQDYRLQPLGHLSLVCKLRLHSAWRSQILVSACALGLCPRNVLGCPYFLLARAIIYYISSTTSTPSSIRPLFKIAEAALTISNLYFLSDKSATFMTGTLL